MMTETRKKYIILFYPYENVHFNENYKTHNPNQPLDYAFSSKLEPLDSNNKKSKKINEKNKLIEKKIVIDEYKEKCNECQEWFFTGEPIILLPCTHYFHRDCIFIWFERYSTCPICNLDLNHLI